MRNVSEQWKLFFNQPKNRKEFFSTVFLLAVVLFILTRFLNYIENRSGITIQDPVHNWIQPVDLTWLTFSLIYISLVVALFYLSRNPYRLMFALQCYIVMVALRIFCMFVVPFDPPPAMIPLADPFAEYFGTGKLLTRDLFFSGHTATLFILYLTAENKKLKLVFLSCTIIVALAVIFQHVHYSIDVIGAIIFTYCSFLIVKKIKGMSDKPVLSGST